ncbi:phosphate uptake regulator PhoU [Nanoarchaeota archaeon]
MVFKEIINTWKKESLLNQAYNDMEKMYALAHNVYVASIKVALYKEKPELEVRKEDQEINKYEKQIRKKVLEHLTLNPKQDVTASLILTSIIIDIERIGDYAKNAIELKETYLKKFELDKYVKLLTGWDCEIKRFFALTKEALDNSDTEKAKQIMERYFVMSKEIDEAIMKLAKDKKMSVEKAVTIVLLARYLKRVGAHLYNIASSVANPFPKIGFKANGEE